MITIIIIIIGGYRGLQFCNIRTDVRGIYCSFATRVSQLKIWHLYALLTGTVS